MTRLTDAENKLAAAPLTRERLKQVLSYNPATGEFGRIQASRRTDRVGVRPGWNDKNGRHFISVDGREYLAHRLAVLWMTGEWPPKGVDHENCDPSKNAWDNLRPANQHQNGANSRKRKGTSSRFKGVTWDSSRQKWSVSIMVNYKRIHLGRFAPDSEEQAGEAYIVAARKHFGEFARAA